MNENEEKRYKIGERLIKWCGLVDLLDCEEVGELVKKVLTCGEECENTIVCSEIVDVAYYFVKYDIDNGCHVKTKQELIDKLIGALEMLDSAQAGELIKATLTYSRGERVTGDYFNRPESYIAFYFIKYDIDHMDKED